MLETVLMTLVCVFAVYGVLSFLCFLAGAFLRNRGEDRLNAYTTVFFKNNEESIEGYIRSVVWDRGFSDFFGDDVIIAVDMGSEDGTLEILRRLEEDYGNLWVMNTEEYINFVRNKRNGRINKNIGYN